MSSDEDDVDSSEDFGSEFSEENQSDSSNEASHEVRVAVFKNLHEHRNDIPLRASTDSYVLNTVSHFKTANFMPPGSVLKVEEVPREDDNGEEEWNVYYLYNTTNYQIEVRVDHEDDNYYIVQVFHKPTLRIVNSGHVYSTKDVVDICEFLNTDCFRDAMLILFAKYGGGNRNMQPRSEDVLQWIVEESELRSTNSGMDP